MSMVVQHNLTAMNANRMLGVTTGKQAKSTEKLSSGYKINRAADDAAGLAISEKMRKQIRGLTQASANAQDGISAVQTAEGALTEVHDMLQRMNELSVKAANGTMSESDRKAVQDEIDQLVTEIDRVAETTKFNETYLLKGDKDVAKGYSYSYSAVKQSVNATAKMDSDSATGLTANITFTKGASAADQNALAKALRDQGMTVSSEQAKDANGNTVTRYSVSLNGKAATNYNVNAISDNQFEIVDLEGNQIATVTASEKKAADDAKSTAEIADGKKIYDENGAELDADKLAAALDADPNAKLYSAVTFAGTSSNNGLTLDATKLTASGTYTYDGTDWKDADGNTLDAGVVTAGTAANGDTITVSVDDANSTAAVADTDYTYTPVDVPKGTATIAAGKKIYDENGAELDAAGVAAALDKDPATKLYSTPAFTGTSSNNGLTLDDSKLTASGTFTYDGADWVDADGNKLDAGVITAGTAANGDTITVAFDAANSTTAVAGKDGDYTYTAPTAGGDSKKFAVITASSITAAQNTGDVAQYYDKDGNAISNNALGSYFSVLSGTPVGGEEEEEVKMIATIKGGATLYDANGNAIADDAALQAILDADPAAKVYTDAPGKGTSSNAALTGITLPTGAAIGTVYTYVAGGDTLPSGGTATGGQAGWYDMTDNSDTIVTITLGAGTAASGDTITVEFDDTAATAATKGTDYDYAPAPAEEGGDEDTNTAQVASKAGTQLYDAVGNTIDMKEAAKSVAASQNQTGALNLDLHVGADATKDNQISLKIESMSAKGLGINGLKVDGSDDSNALNAIETIKAAISKVSTQRSALGAVQNRLEHTINNLDNVVENTTSAESQIRDTDMAKQMVEYSKYQILAQAGQSMLAQANQSNQGVLSLLQ